MGAMQAAAAALQHQVPSCYFNLYFRMMERKRSIGFRRIFTAAFLLFLALRGALTLQGND